LFTNLKEHKKGWSRAVLQWPERQALDLTSFPTRVSSPPSISNDHQSIMLGSPKSRPHSPFSVVSHARCTHIRQPTTPLNLQPKPRQKASLSHRQQKRAITLRPFTTLHPVVSADRVTLPVTGAPQRNSNTGARPPGRAPVTR
jgi:hypothetical protein